MYLGNDILVCIVVLDLAIAQIAGAGVAFASIMGWDWALQLSAVVAAMLGGALFTWTEKKWSAYQEPLIGVFFMLFYAVFFSASI